MVILPTDAKAEEISASSRLRPLSARSYSRLSDSNEHIYFRGDFTVTHEDQLTTECLDFIVGQLCKRLKRERAAILSVLFPSGPKANRKNVPLVITIQGRKQLPLVPLLSRESHCVTVRGNCPDLS